MKELVETITEFHSRLQAVRMNVEMIQGTFHDALDPLSEDGAELSCEEIYNIRKAVEFCLIRLRDVRVFVSDLEEKKCSK